MLELRVDLDLRQQILPRLDDMSGSERAHGLGIAIMEGSQHMIVICCNACKS